MIQGRNFQSIRIRNSVKLHWHAAFTKLFSHVFTKCGKKECLDLIHCKIAKNSNGFLFYYHQDNIGVEIVLLNLPKWEVGEEGLFFVWPDVRVWLQHESVEDILLKLVISAPCILSPQHPYAFVTRLKGFLEKKE